MAARARRVRHRDVHQDDVGASARDDRPAPSRAVGGLADDLDVAARPSTSRSPRGTPGGRRPPAPGSRGQLRLRVTPGTGSRATTSVPPPRPDVVPRSCRPPPRRARASTASPTPLDRVAKPRPRSADLQPQPVGSTPRAERRTPCPRARRRWPAPAGRSGTPPPRPPPPALSRSRSPRTPSSMPSVGRVPAQRLDEPSWSREGGRSSRASRRTSASASRAASSSRRSRAASAEPGSCCCAERVPSSMRDRGHRRAEVVVQVAADPPALLLPGVHEPLPGCARPPRPARRPRPPSRRAGPSASSSRASSSRQRRSGRYRHQSPRRSRRRRTQRATVTSSATRRPPPATARARRRP